MLHFKDGKFRIMQIADVQEIPQVSPDTVRLIALAVRKEKPDLIVFSGDQLYGPIPLFRIGNAEENVRRTLAAILAPIEAAGIPFAVTFGNHDDQCGVKARRQAEIYAEFPHYEKGESRADDDPGTLLLTLHGADGSPAANLLLVDSGRQEGAGAYNAVSPAQLAWIRATLTDRPQPAYVFQHIPVPEYYRVLQRAKRGEKGAKEAFRTHAHEFYRLPAALVSAGGFMGETPAIPDENTGEFDLLRALGTVRGIFVGHDHKNSFRADLDGIALVYTQGAGFHAYGPGKKRGVRLIELDEKDAAAFVTHTLTFEDLTDAPLRAPLIPFVMDRLPTTLEQVKRIAACGAAGALVGAAAVCGILYKRKR